MMLSKTRTTLLLLAILIGLGIVGRLDYEDAVKLEQAEAKAKQTTEVAKR